MSILDRASILSFRLLYTEIKHSSIILLILNGLSFFFSKWNKRPKTLLFLTIFANMAHYIVASANKRMQNKFCMTCIDKIAKMAVTTILIAPMPLTFSGLFDRERNVYIMKRKGNWIMRLRLNKGRWPYNEFIAWQTFHLLSILYISSIMKSHSLGVLFRSYWYIFYSKNCFTRCRTKKVVLFLYNSTHRTGNYYLSSIMNHSLSMEHKIQPKICSSRHFWWHLN